MIRDFWKIKEKTLHQEILALQQKSVDKRIVDTLIALKSIGNIGAHPDKDEDINRILDVSPGEAETLIKMLEYLIKSWYVARYDEEQMFNEIVSISEGKKAQRSSSAGITPMK